MLTRRSLIGSASAAALAAAAPARAQDKPLKKVTVVTNHQQISLGSDVYIYAVPHQLGFFKEEGLDVTFVFSQGSAAAVQLVVGGKADVGQSNPGPIMAAIQKGAPLKGFLNTSPAYTSGLAVLEESPIKSTRDLKPGMLIGVASLASGHVPTVRGMIRHIGLKPDEDIKLVAIGTGAQAATALRTGQVQAMFLWDLAYNPIIARGQPLRIIRDVMPDIEKVLDGVQFASAEFIAKNPDVIAGLGRAQAKGIAWSNANPTAALELFYKTWPDVRARNDEQRQSELKIFTLNLGVDTWWLKGAKQYGLFRPDYVQATAKFLTNSGELQPVADPKVFYTNEFVDRFNAFDFDKVQAAAKAYK